MTERMTRKRLETKLDKINAYLVRVGQPELDLNYAACYGGYELAYVLSNNHVTPQRMSAREMFNYLDGMETALWMTKGKA